MSNEPNSSFSSSSPPLLPEIRTFDREDMLLVKTYRRYLPHWELQGSTYFITVRVVKLLERPFLNSDLAMIMIAHLKQLDKQKYFLQAYVIMPDHLHLIIKPIQGYRLAEIMQAIKGGSSYQLNKFMNRKGQFWQKENFDHIIRDRVNLREKWNYIRDNPVKANLVVKAEEYPFSSFYEFPEIQAKACATAAYKLKLVLQIQAKACATNTS